MDNTNRNKLAPNPIKNPDLKQVKKGKKAFQQTKKYFQTWHVWVMVASIAIYWIGSVMFSMIGLKFEGHHIGTGLNDAFSIGDLIVTQTILMFNYMLHDQHKNKMK